MKRWRGTIGLVLAGLLLATVGALAPAARTALGTPALPAAAQLLQADANGPVEIVWSPERDSAEFIRGEIPLAVAGAAAAETPSAAATAFVTRYAGLFGVTDATAELQAEAAETDGLGFTHITLRQVHQGVEVYNGEIRVHLAADGENVQAASSSFAGGIALDDVQPELDAASAEEEARRYMSEGVLARPLRLVVFAGALATKPNEARLAWLVDLRDDAAPARNVYVIDADNGVLLDILSRLYTQNAAPDAPQARSRSTYDAENRTSLPGQLARSEGERATGDVDVDRAHDFAGATYDYYLTTHGRDSFDNAGAALISTANYGRNYQNAFWNGEQMVYGDNFAVNDVVAHELTHAVIEYTANLEYRWQSGALNESLADIFGAMVDRGDWLMGEDLPSAALGGREAIRDLQDPERFGQPAHADDWQETCQDNEGVHTNSGIPNKAYYEIATAIGSDVAEEIFYRMMATYLTSTSSLNAARSGALQAAQDLYSGGSVEYSAVNSGFAAVGINGSWSPQENDCSCAATAALLDAPAATGAPSAADTLGALYDVRDLLLGDSAAGQHYRNLYYQNTLRISFLLLKNDDLRTQGAGILQTMTPGLDQLANGHDGEPVVTNQDVVDVTEFLRDLAADDRKSGNGHLADTIDAEMARIEWPELVGKSYDDAWAYINGRVTDIPSMLYLPAVSK